MSLAVWFEVALIFMLRRSEKHIGLDMSVGWLVGWSVGWLVGWSVGLQKISIFVLNGRRLNK